MIQNLKMGGFSVVKMCTCIYYNDNNELKIILQKYK